MIRKPRVLTRCVANTYTDTDERIIEFSFPSERDSAGCPKGGLICFRVAETSDGARVPRVEVYHTDGEVLVIPPEKQPVQAPPRPSEPLKHEVFMVCMKRRDGGMPKPEKSDGRVYTRREDAEAALNSKPSDLERDAFGVFRVLLAFEEG